MHTVSASSAAASSRVKLYRGIEFLIVGFTIEIFLLIL